MFYLFLGNTNPNFCTFALMMNTSETLTLEELTSRLSGVIASESSLRNVWVTAETSDVRRAMHCYLELIQKDPLTGEPVARIRATIWRSALARIDADFAASTGNRLASGMKVRVFVSVNYHPSYGLSLNITDIDAAYTMGNLVRLRCSPPYRCDLRARSRRIWRFHPSALYQPPPPSFHHPSLSCADAGAGSSGRHNIGLGGDCR